MALQFQAPDSIIQNYLNRPTPGQEATAGIQQALQTYVSMKAQQAKSEQDKLDSYIKAFGEGGPALAADYAKRVGLKNPPTLPGLTATMAGPGGTAGVMSSQQPVMQPPTTAPIIPTAEEEAAQQSLPWKPPQTPPPMTPATPPMPTMQSPIIAHWNNSMAGQSQAPGAATAPAPAPAPSPAVAPPQLGVPGMEHPEQYLDMGAYGTKKLQAGEALGSFREKMQTAAEKDLENAPRSANQLRQDFTLAGQPDKADAWLQAHAPESLNNPDQPLINVAKIKEAKDWLGTGAMQMRGNYFDTMGNVQTQKLREGLIKDAKTTLDPMFQQGEGRAQMQRINNIGRTEPLITQMLGQKRGGDPRQMVELATRVDAVLKGSPGGQQAIEGINRLVPQTALGKFASWVEWFKSEPFGTEQQAFIHRYADTINREKTAIQGQIKQTAERGAGTLRVLKSQFPEDYNAIVNPYLQGKYTELTGPQATNAPAIGTVEDGHRFKGGNPADPNSWEAVQ